MASTAREKNVKIVRRAPKAPLTPIRALEDRIVLRHTGDVPTRKTISLPDGAYRAMTLIANSIANIPMQF
jgi:uncharacterized lipoprotein YbaY